jgi:hypothetical protein
MAKKRILKTSPGIEIPEHFYKKWVGERETPVKVRGCDRPGCGERGDFRAPKSRRDLNDYYWFCLDHVKDYNANWDYYKGLTVEEMEEAIRFGSQWERPTWPFGTLKEKKVREAFRRTFEAEDAETIHAKAEMRGIDPRLKAELNALRELGLVPPVDFEAIKKQYRLMVKKHHPDVQGGDKEAEEKIKRLNAAFTLLKIFYAEQAEADV